MRSDTATTGRVRLVVTLSVLSAAMVVAGGAVMIAGTDTRLLDGRLGDHPARLGAAVGAAGLALGLVTLLAFVFTRSGQAQGTGPAKALVVTGVSHHPSSQTASSC